MLNMKYPVIINKTIESIAQTATPIALICIGAGFEGRKAIKKIKPTLVATFIKLIGLAAVFIPIGVALGFRKSGACRSAYYAGFTNNSNKLCYGKEYG